MANTPALDDLAVQEQFLDALRSSDTCGVAASAMKACGLSKAATYRYKAAHPAFSLEWDKAVKVGAQKKLGEYEASLHQRATQGYAVPVYGLEWVPEADALEAKDPLTALEHSRRSMNIVGWKQIPPSDRLLELALKAEARDKYAPPTTKVDVHTSGQDSLIAEIQAACDEQGIPYTADSIREAIMAFVRQSMPTADTVSEQVS